MPFDSRSKDERGNVYHSLEVIAEAESEGKGARWICRCDCGSLVTVRAAQLRRGDRKDCGCGLSSVKKFKNALVDIGDPPCDKGCLYRQRCLEDEMACQQFRSWYEWGGDIQPFPETFRPTKAMFKAIYEQDKQPNKRRKRRTGSAAATVGREALHVSFLICVCTIAILFFGFLLVVFLTATLPLLLGATRYWSLMLSILSDGCCSGGVGGSEQ